MLDGKILLVTNDFLFFSKGLLIYKAERETGKYKEFVRLPAGPATAFLASLHIISRLLRWQVHHMLEDGDGGYYVIYNKLIIRLSSAGIPCAPPSKLVGSRPLCVIKYLNELVYGEYISNNQRKRVGIYSFDGYRQSRLAEVQGVRHIHGLFYDQFEDKIYVTTGDYGDEAGIWHLNSTTMKLEPILQGGQQARAVQLLFCKDFIYFGTDAPNEQNFIYRIEKRSRKLEKLGKVCSSVFYGTSIGGSFYFSTVVEPSFFNAASQIDLLEVRKERVRKVVSFEKDVWSKKYFQYGQLNFPSYSDSCDNRELWVYKLGVLGSGTSQKLT